MSEAMTETAVHGGGRLTREHLELMRNTARRAVGDVPLEWRMSQSFHDNEILPGIMPGVVIVGTVSTLLGFPVRIVDDIDDDYVILGVVDE